LATWSISSLFSEKEARIICATINRARVAKRKGWGVRMSERQSQETVDQQRTLTPRMDQECDRFEAGWSTGGRPRIEDYVGALSEAERPALLRDLILLEVV